MPSLDVEAWLAESNFRAEANAPTNPTDPISPIGPIRRRNLRRSIDFTHSNRSHWIRKEETKALLRSSHQFCLIVTPLRFAARQIPKSLLDRNILSFIN